MNVSLTTELDKFVASKVETGRYASASEVVREALRLLEEQEQERKTRVSAFDKKIGARLASLDRGESLKPGAVRARIAQKSRDRRKLSA